MKLALGTAQLGLDYGIANTRGKVAGAEAEAILRYTREAGITTLDTAVAYGDSESRLGAIGVEGCDVVSKLPAVPDDCPDVSEWMIGLVGQSLAKLRLERLYAVLLHRPAQLLEARGAQIYAALQQLKVAGLARKVGASIYQPSELDEIFGQHPLDLIQAPFNLFDHRILDSGWLTRLKQAGAEVHARSIFLQGALLFSPEARPTRFQRWASHFERYDAWMRSHGRTPLQACVGHALSVPEFDKVVVGVDSAAQLRCILTAAEAPPPPYTRDLIPPDAALLDPRVWTNL